MQRVLREIADEIGLADTLTLARRWAGRTLAVPVKVGPNDPLALTLGYDTAQRLVRAFAGVRLQFPVERNACIDLRNAAIWRACVIDGRSHDSVALEFGLARQTIGFILAKMRERASHDMELQP